MCMRQLVSSCMPYVETYHLLLFRLVSRLVNQPNQPNQPTSTPYPPPFFRPPFQMRMDATIGVKETQRESLLLAVSCLLVALSSHSKRPPLPLLLATTLLQPLTVCNLPPPMHIPPLALPRIEGLVSWVALKLYIVKGSLRQGIPLLEQSVLVLSANKVNRMDDV